MVKQAYFISVNYTQEISTEVSLIRASVDKKVMRFMDK